MRSLLQSVSSMLFGKNSARLVVSLGAILALGGSPLGLSALADDINGAPSFKADVPRVDPNAERQAAPQKPLQAGIQLNHHGAAPRVLKSGANDGGRFMGKMRGGARQAEPNP